jgi:hypothetical protein
VSKWEACEDAQILVEIAHNEGNHEKNEELLQAVAPQAPRRRGDRVTRRAFITLVGGAASNDLAFYRRDLWMMIILS